MCMYMYTNIHTHIYIWIAIWIGYRELNIYIRRHYSCAQNTFQKKKKPTMSASSLCWKGSRINCCQLHFVQMCHDDSYFFSKMAVLPICVIILIFSFNCSTPFGENRNLRLKPLQAYYNVCSALILTILPVLERK